MASLIGLVTVIGWLSPDLRAQTAETDSLDQNYRYYDRPVNVDRYLVRPGDRLTVSFLGARLAALSIPVNAEGRTVHPNIGLIDVAGRTLGDVKTDLLAALAGRYTADEIDISIGTPFRVAVNVSGEVRRPGLYVGYTSQLVSEIIEDAGGLTDIASRRRIEFLGGPQPIRVDLERARVLGDPDADPCLYAGFHIHVPAMSDQTIDVTGWVRRPRRLELNDGDDLATLIQFCGGVKRGADISHLKVAGDPGRVVTSRADIRYGDVVVVPPPMKTDSSRISVFGEVLYPGVYVMREGSQLADVFRASGGMTGEANRPRTTVFRLASVESESGSGNERFGVAVGRSADALESFQLQSDDSVYVPRRLGFVRVSGQVARPGLMPYRMNRSAAEYIQMAGGYLNDADRDQIVVVDRLSGVAAELGADATVADGDEVVVMRREVQP